MGFTASMKDDLPAVFGTFGVRYDSSEFEREREDGFTAIGMVPDCRVFIYGTEFTKDIKDVSISNSISGNTCEITITNPRGRYEISKQDLMGKWREDKDILLAYDYDQFQRPSKRETEQFMDKITPTVFGRKTANQIKNGMNAATTFNSTMGYNFGVPKVRGITRKIFETKYYSGLSKYTGDVVFDYKDPVFVFFKGRFSPLWYFGFTGIVTGWDDSDAYGQVASIKLKCEDILSLWKRAKLTKQGAMFPFSRGEDRHKSTQTGTAFNYVNDLAGAFNFTDMIKMAIFSYDYSKYVNNCHASRPGQYVDQETTGVIADLTSSDKYKQYRRELQSDALIDSGTPTVGVGQTDVKSGKYMFTKANPYESCGFGADFPQGEAAWSGVTAGGGAYRSFGGGNIGATSDPRNSGLVDIRKIKYLHPKLFKTKEYVLNEASYGPTVSVYMQLNEIEFPKNVKFTGQNLKSYLDISVRYWEAKHQIADNYPAPKAGDLQLKGTGWKDNKAFGIAGVHPALTYEFISNFNILDNVWEQCFKHKKELDTIILSPNDKIRASVGGEPTEMAASGSFTERPAGTAFNLFRPRLFVVLPRRFSDRYKKAQAAKFAQFSNLFEESKTSVYEFLKEKLKSVEFVMYASPAGDVFIEPELYDFHPLDFSTKIEDRSIVKKKLQVRFKAHSGDAEKPVARVDNAYFFDPKANHPFFIMEKDRMRNTQTFDHKLIHTEVTVVGGKSAGGGILEIFEGDITKAVTSVSDSGVSRGNARNSLVDGRYIADGFQKQYDSNSVVSSYKKAYEEKLVNLNQSVFKKLYTEKGDMSIRQLMEVYIANTIDIYNKCKDDPAKQKTFVFFWDTAKTVYNELATYSEITSNITNAQVNLVLKFFFKNLNTYSPNTKFKDLVKAVVNKRDAAVSKAMNSSSSITMKEIKNKITAEYEASLLLLGSLVPSSNSPADANVLFELITIGTVDFLDDDSITTVLGDTVESYNNYIDQGGGSPLQVRNLAEARLATVKGMYDPRLDMVKHYGYNPKDPIKNTFIKSGDEAYEYARTIFNRLKGKAFQISMDVIGRPEFCLNRPYYCERKDSIGLLSKFTLNYSYGDSFRSNVNLEYIRKNSITFNYSLGELDAFSKTDYNSMFLTQANTYYKMLKNSPSLVGKFSGMITESIAGSSPGEQRATLAKLAGGAANNIGNSFLPPGGIYSAHDRIGHIPFDTRWGEVDELSAITVSPAISEKYPDEVTAYVAALSTLYELCMSIKNNIENRNTLEKQQENIKKELDKNTKDQKTTVNKVTQAETQLKNINLSEKDRKLYTDQLVSSTTALNKLFGTAEALKQKRISNEANIKKYNIALYGEEEKPKDLTTFISSAYASFMEFNDSMPESRVYGVMDSLFFQLFQTYTDATFTDTKEHYVIWNVFEDKNTSQKKTGSLKKNFGAFGTTDFYMEIKPNVKIKLTEQQQNALLVSNNAIVQGNQ